MSICPSCGGLKDAHKYLCGGCWGYLPGTTKHRLYRRDDKASMRLLELHRALRRKVPLNEIEVSS